MLVGSTCGRVGGTGRGDVALVSPCLSLVSEPQLKIRRCAPATKECGGVTTSVGAVYRVCCPQ